MDVQRCLLNPWLKETALNLGQTLDKHSIKLKLEWCFFKISGKEDLKVPVLSAESKLDITKYLLHKTLPDLELVHLIMWVNTEETLASVGFMSTNIKNKTQLY